MPNTAAAGHYGGSGTFAKLPRDIFSVAGSWQEDIPASRYFQCCRLVVGGHTCLEIFSVLPARGRRTYLPRDIFSLSPVRCSGTNLRLPHNIFKVISLKNQHMQYILTRKSITPSLDYAGYYH
jgi:hypothetical protein